MQCLRIKPNVVPLPEAAGSLCLYGNNTKENSWDTDIESSSPLSTTDRQSIMLSPNIMPTWSPSASDFQTCAASSSVGNFQTGKTSSSVSDFETSVTSPSASRTCLTKVHHWMQYSVQLCGILVEFTKQADKATISGSFHDIIDLAEH
ncbi:hypothetical protein EMCRGX_G004950 [Ephydatia muelleri]